MVDLLLVPVVVVILGIPFLIGMYSVYWNVAGQSADNDSTRTAPSSIYHRGIELAKVPAVLVFLVLALISNLFQVFVLGYAGGPPPWSIMAQRVVGVTLLLAVYIGGLTIAGSVLAVYLHTRRSKSPCA